MDVSVARHQSDSNRATAARQMPDDPGAIKPPAEPALAPANHVWPARHGVLMGLAAAASVAFTACCMASVAGRLGPGRRYLNGAIILISLVTGIYVGFRVWRKQLEPRPISRGKCPDCGRETIAGDEACSLCGRPADGAKNQA